MTYEVFEYTGRRVPKEYHVRELPSKDVICVCAYRWQAERVAEALVCHYNKGNEDEGHHV